MIERLGIDFEPWKALTLASLRIDLRTSALGGSREAGQGLRPLVVQIAFYGVMGLLIAVLVWPIRDVFATGLITVSYVMFMVGMATLLDHNAVITSPDDHAILGFRPVTSRTYFAARLANVLVYTTSMTLVFGVFPALAILLRHGVAVGAAASVALVGASLLTALFMVVIYAGLMQAVGAARLRHALSYTQLVFSFAVYGGYFVMAQVADADSRAGFQVAKTAAILLAPPSWFASYLELADGRQGPADVLPAAASVAALGLLACALRGRLSMDYADRLASLAAGGKRKRAVGGKRRRLPFFSGGEARAVALLVGAQFRHDAKFRMSVLAILPLTVVYLFIGIRQWGGRDPFERGELAPNLSMITIAMLMFPTLLKISLARSDAYRASWVFFSCPADRVRILRASTRFLGLVFLLPYLALVGLALAYVSGNAPYIALYLIVVGLVSHIVLLLATWAEPEIPFSKPVQKGSAASRVLFLMVTVGLGSAVFPLAGPIMAESAVAAAALIAALVLAGVAVDRGLARRIARDARELEFQG